MKSIDERFFMLNGDNAMNKFNHTACWLMFDKTRRLHIRPVVCALGLFVLLQAVSTPASSADIKELMMPKSENSELIIPSPNKTDFFQWVQNRANLDPVEYQREFGNVLNAKKLEDVIAGVLVNSYNAPDANYRGECQSNTGSAFFSLFKSKWEVATGDELNLEIRNFQHYTSMMKQACPSAYFESATNFFQDYSDLLDKKLLTVASQHKKREDLKEKKRIAAQNCLQSKEYQLFEAAHDIESSRDIIKFHEAILQKESNIENRSGVSNLSTRYESGQAIENEKISLEKSFSKYKSLGGSAKSISDVSSIKNPCE